MCWPARISRFFVKRRVSLPERAKLRRSLWLIPVLFSRVLLFVWAIRHYDVFIMGGGSSFFRMLDLPLLRCFGRRVIYVLHGTDARPAYIDGTFYQERHAKSRIYDEIPPPIDDEYIDACVKITKMRRRDVLWIERYAELVVSGPGYSQLLEKPYVNFAIVGIPFSPPPLVKVKPRQPDSRVRILHATSDLVVRGTGVTRKIIKGLVRQGLPIDFIVLTGEPHRRVLEELQICDFVIDGQYADTPMAGFATEAAHFGKAVAMSGYYAANLNRDMPEETIPPTCFTTPDKMEAVIRKLIEDEDYRGMIGERLQSFVREAWTPQSVAAKFLVLLEGNTPATWWNDPYRNLYWLGGGISEDRIRAVVSSIIRRHGIKALQLSHNPELEGRLLEFVKGESA